MKKKIFLQQSKDNPNNFVVCNEKCATHYRFEDDENAELSNNAEFLPLPTMNFAKDSKLETTNPIPYEPCEFDVLPTPNYSGQAESSNNAEPLQLPTMNFDTPAKKDFSNGALQLPKMF